MLVHSKSMNSEFIMVATTMTIKYFDTLDYVRKAKEIKDPEILAEYQVKQMESAIETAVQYVQQNSSVDVTQIRDEINNKEWATKSDVWLLKSDILNIKSDFELKINAVELKIAHLRYEMIKFIIWTGVGSVITLGTLMTSLMAYGFHWFSS